MPYELRLAPPAQRDISEYIGNRFETGQIEALEAIQRELRKLATSPRLGSIPPGAFGRPIYRLRIIVEDTTYYIQAVYCYSEDEKAIVITGLKPLEL
jgi:plasmid stabilization system protein ParE